MALFTPSQSPAVVVKEVDLTGGVPNVQTSTGAIVGNFRWGPIGERKLVTNEAGLVEIFASPDSDNAVDFVSAAQFLRYSNSLQVVRGATSAAKNSYAMKGGGSTAAAKKLDNKLEFDAASFDSDELFVGRFPGALGNSLRVSVCPASTSDSAFDNWTYKSSFDGAPGTSSYDSDRDGVNSEVHIAVVDNNGEFSGTKGTVLETYPYVSVFTNSKNREGGTNYAKNVINERSQYVYMVAFDSDLTAGGAGVALTPGTQKSISLSTNATNHDLGSGVNSGSLGTTEIANSSILFQDKDQVEIDFMIANGMADSAAQATVVNDLVAKAIGRKDCVVVASPHRNAVVNQTLPSTITTNITSVMGNFTKSSYLVVDGNYLKVYDKYNDQYIQVPAASSTAGIMAETDRVAAPWFSPAGTRRGQYLGVTSIDYNPTKAQRDTLYKAGVNPVVNINGSGIVLFGDKTALQRPSAFDRINVRRLFLTLERAIAKAAENVMFEFNDEFTRAEFVNIIEPVLRDVRGRRGITDFRIVADESVNTPAVIDRNEFVANIFIKPARSVNYVTLNFTAVRTGVDFEEVVGTV